ncbi:hypothetical protein BZG36_02675 [Bifiguratus adelaidae]|uniref:E3 ubiquitin-protein ligase listerin n=1 Tax=Bifiguratus adelaidae TaxID=1938954 RepID=A0A261Y1L6_9FUNG|nr:hypothetical protein BZG36_02675 [Bifiguratus adelaidae]
MVKRTRTNVPVTFKDHVFLRNEYFQLRGRCILRLNSAEDAQDFIQKNNGVFVGGNRITVHPMTLDEEQDRSRDPLSRFRHPQLRTGAGQSVVVTGLPKIVEREELVDYLKSKGFYPSNTTKVPVRELKVAPAASVRKYLAEFKSPSEAYRCARKLHGTLYKPTKYTLSDFRLRADTKSAFALVMGRADKHNRTKGNLQPASSRRAADLLSGSNPFPASGLGGFAQFAAGIPPIQQAAGDTSSTENERVLSQDLPAELLVVFRKLTKRDTTTKTRSLEEFSSYLERETLDASSIQAVLAIWSPLYTKLALDVDRRVRLLTNMTHRYVAKQAGKLMAPQLKVVMGVWLCSQFDPYKEVARAATDAFEGVFSKEKQKGVYVFCQREILAFISETLLEKDADTLSDPRFTNEEERAQKYARVIAQCLDSLSFLIEYLTTGERQDYQDEYTSLFGNKKLWSFFGFTDAQVRRATYRFLKVLILQSPGAVEQYEHEIVPAFLPNALADSYNLNSGALWDTLLVLTKNFPRAWTVELSRKKNSVTLLMRLLSSIDTRCAPVVFPSLLPLIANMPQDVVIKEEFAGNFFKDLWKGVTRVDSSVLNDGIASYFECLFWYLKRNGGSDPEICNVQELLLETSIWSPIKFALRDADVVKKLNGANRQKLMAITGANTGYVMSLSKLDGAEGSAFRQNLQGVVCVVIKGMREEQNAGPDDTSTDAATFIQSMCARIDAKACSREVLATFLKATMESLSACHGSGTPLMHLLRILCDLAETANVGHKASEFLSKASKLTLSSYSDLVHIILYHTDLPAESVASVIHSLITSTAAENRIGFVDTWLQQTYESTERHSFASLITLEISNLADALGQSEMLMNSSLIAGSAVGKALWFEDDTLLHAPELLRIYGSLADAIKSSAFSWCHLHETTAIPSLAASLKALAVASDKVSMSHFLEEHCDVLPDIFDLSRMSTTSDDASTVTRLASEVWTKLAQSNLESSTKSSLRSAFKSDIHNKLNDIAYPLSIPSMIVRLRTLIEDPIVCSNTTEKAEFLSAILPTDSQWQNAFAFFGEPRQAFSFLSMVDPLYAVIDYSGISTNLTSEPQDHYDEHGQSSYSRMVEFSLMLIETDAMFESVQQNHPRLRFLLWYLQHYLYTYKANLDLPSLPAPKLQPDHELAQSYQVDISGRIAVALQKLLFIDDEKDYTSKTVTSQIDKVNSDSLLHLSVLKALDRESPHAPAVLRGYFGALISLGKMTSSHLDQWISDLLDGGFKDIAVELALLYGILPAIESSQKCAIMQNQFAGRLTELIERDGFDNVNVRNLALKLGVFAQPSLTKGVPHQRSFYLAKAVKNAWTADSATEANIETVACVLRWIVSSEPSMGDDTWTFVLSWCLERLEALAANESPVGSKYAVLRLLGSFRTLCEENEEAAEVLRRGRAGVDQVILDLLVVDGAISHSDAMTKPLREYLMCLSVSAVDVNQNTLLSRRPLGEISSLLHSMDENVQKTAYILLRRLIRESTQEMAIEAELATGSDDNSQFLIPSELLEIASLDALLPSKSHDREQTFGYLLAWMAIFDYFDDSTFKLKSAQIDQLKERGDIFSFIPYLFDLLEITSRILITDLSRWDLTEFDVSGFKPDSDVGFYVLAAHLYHRALLHVPSLVRSWWTECKDRQLVVAVESFTERFYSTDIVQYQIAELRRPETKAAIEDDDTSVRVLKGSNEVVATYQVDDQQVEISLKIPKNYPLRHVEVEGLSRVGVSEARWRGWLLATSSVMVSQNGSLGDALVIFKRNVSLHFAGVEDCTICYSVISIQDRSLPTKQCKTCKNKYHACCLYKQLSNVPNIILSGQDSLFASAQIAKMRIDL